MRAFGFLAAAVLLPSLARAEITSTSGTGYAARCNDQGVPLPPKWGGPSSLWRVVPRHNVPPDPRFIQGHFGDTYNFGNQESFSGQIWYWESLTAPKGVCIIAAHDGRLWAANNGERGASFTFTLPALAARAAA